MSLTIERCLTRAIVPRGLRQPLPSFERLGRGPFADECGRQLSGRWPTGETVWRIRWLRVQLRLSIRELSDEQVSRAWAAAFVEELLDTLGRPPGAGGIEAVRAASRGEWLAAFLGDLVAGSASGKWQYGEFEELTGDSAADAVVRLFEREPSACAEALTHLGTAGRLGRVLATLDDLACERVFAAVGRSASGSAPSLVAADLIAVARLLLAGPRVRGRIASRQRALALFAASVDCEERSLTPRQLFHALQALDLLLGIGHPVGSPGWQQALTRHAAVSAALSPEAASAIDDLRMSAQGESRAHVRDGEEALGQLRERLDGQAIVRASAAPEPERWAHSNAAGIFLLADGVRRLGWTEHLRGSVLAQRYGPRATTYVLAGVAMSVLRQFSDAVPSIDPAAALFAGWLVEPDLGGLRRALKNGDRPERRDLLTRLLSTAIDLDAAAASWSALFDRLASEVVLSFGARVRGFRQATVRALVSQFLATPGRMLVADECVTVIIAPSPFHVALRISSAADSIDSVDWLGGRRLELVLEEG